MDKLVDLARLVPDWRFDVVGYGPGDLPAAPPPNLVTHGFLPLPRYEALLAAADIDIVEKEGRRLAFLKELAKR